MRFRTITFICLAVFSGIVAQASQKEINVQFVSEMFADLSPEFKALWLSPELRSGLREILGHAPQSLRLKYYRNSNRTLWIFDEIGKVKPITIGVFIRSGQIENIRVLKFRESRGWEIKYSFFTDQFQGMSLTEQKRLNAPVDGITGATLSVGAMKRVARASLYLDHAVTGEERGKTINLSTYQGDKNQ